MFFLKKENKKLKKNQITGIFSILFFFVLTKNVWAVEAVEYVLLEQLPGMDPQTSDLGSYLQIIFKFGVILAGILAVLMIVLGGFQYITSEIPSLKGDGKQKIQDALFGLLMILISWVLLNTINPDLTLLDNDLFNNDLDKVEVEYEETTEAVDDTYDLDSGETTEGYQNCWCRINPPLNCTTRQPGALEINNYTQSIVEEGTCGN